MKPLDDPPTPTEAAAVLSLRNALRIEWADDAQQLRALEWFRVNELRKMRAKRSDYEANRLARMKDRERS